MTMTFDEGKPSPEEYLEHYGKKGMKWGHRKKYSTADIKSARGRQNVRERALANIEDRALTAKTPAARKAADAKLTAAEKSLSKHPDAAVAAKLTRGEKVALLALTGPVGAVVIGANAVSTRRMAKKNQK